MITLLFLCHSYFTLIHVFSTSSHHIHCHSYCRISLPHSIDAEQLKEQSSSPNITTDDVTNGTYTSTVVRHTYILSNSDPWAITNTSVLLTVYNYTDAPTAGDDQNVFQVSHFLNFFFFSKAILWLTDKK